MAELQNVMGFPLERVAKGNWVMLRERPGLGVPLTRVQVLTATLGPRWPQSRPPPQPGLLGPWRRLELRTTLRFLRGRPVALYVLGMGGAVPGKSLLGTEPAGAPGDRAEPLAFSPWEEERWFKSAERGPWSPKELSGTAHLSSLSHRCTYRIRAGPFSALETQQKKTPAPWDLRAMGRAEAGESRKRT